MNLKLLLTTCFFIFFFSLSAQNFREKKEGGFVGLQDLGGNIVIPAIYEMVINNGGDAIAVYKDKNWELISIKNKETLPFVFDGLSYGDGYYYVSKDNKTGLFDYDGNNIIPISYKSIDFDENSEYLIVQDFDEKFGVIDVENNLLIDFKYERLEFFNDEAFIAEDINSGKNGVIDIDEKLILPYEYFEIKRGVDDESFIVKKDPFEKTGVVNITGNIIIPFDYNDISIFKYDKNYYLVETDYVRGYLQGLLDSLGNMVLPTEYKWISGKSGDLFEVTMDKIHFGYVDSNNNYVLKPEFGFSGFSSIYFWLRQKVDDKKWYIYYPKSNTFDTQTYDSYKYDFYSDHLYLEKDGLFTLVDRNLKTIIPYKYSYLEPSVNNSITACLNGKWGLINQKEEILIPFIYDDMMILSEESIALKKNKEWVVMDLNNKKVTINNFDEVIQILPNRTWMYYFVKKGDKYGIIDEYGSIIKDIEYEIIKKNEILDFEVKKDDRWGVFSLNIWKKGKIDEIIPIIFEDITYDTNYYKVKKDNTWWRYDTNFQTAVAIDD